MNGFDSFLNKLFELVKFVELVVKEDLCYGKDVNDFYL